jgi:hypothetical protein
MPLGWLRGILFTQKLGKMKHSLLNTGGNMPGGYIEKRIKKTNLRLIILGVLGLIVVLLSMPLSIRYFRNFIFGPYQLTGSDLVKYLNEDYMSEDFVTIKADKVFDSGYYDSYTDSDGNNVISHYYYVVEKDGYQLIYQTDAYNGETNVTGEIFWLKTSSISKFQAAINQTGKGSTAEFLPMIMDDNNYRGRGYAGIVLIAITLTLSLVLIITGAKRIRHPELHPSLKDLLVFGPTEFIPSRINIEMENQHQSVGKVHFLNTWLLVETRSGFSATRYENIVWAYKQNVVSKNFGIAFGNVQSLMIHDSYQKTLYIPCKSGTVDQLMKSLMTHIPYAYKGYSIELARVWAQNPQALARSVEERKTATTSTPTSDAPPAEPPATPGESPKV